MGSDMEFELPVVDLGGATWKEGSEARAAVAGQLRETLRESESCHVINHGVPLEVLDEIRKRSTEFFTLPKEEKYKYHVDELPQRPHRTESVRVTREGFREAASDFNDSTCARETVNCISRPIEDRMPQLWPEMLRESVMAYSDAVYGLSTLILELLSESFGQQPSAFKVGLGEGDMQTLSVHHYPALDPGTNSSLASVIGTEPHTDTTALTILLDNGVPGLQMIQKGGQWATLKPLAGAFILQTGVFLEVLTNGALKARVHRVCNPKIPSPLRLGIACGYRTMLESIVKPLPQLLSTGTPALYRPLDRSTYMKWSRGDKMKGVEALDPWKIKQDE